jgi:predicted protein tyrosine phosphatase
MNKCGGAPLDLTIHRVMGVDELEETAIASASRIVSILGPRDDVPPALVNVGAPVLTLRFDDIIAPEPEATMPTKGDVRRLLAFDKDADHRERLLIHCTAGISRSAAALVALLAARHPELHDEIFHALRQIRPQAWPNSLIVAFADDLLGRGGALTEALRRHYEAQVQHPEPD